MANVQQITRDYLLRARTEGVAATTAAAQQLGAATDTLATKTETVTKSQISAATALDRLQRQLDASYRSAKQLETAQRDLERAQAQGLISTARHAELTALASKRYTEMGSAANDNIGALERLGNTLTRRVIFAFLIKETKEAISALFNLNTELAKVGDIASRVGAGAGSFQGLDFAATIKGVKDFPGAMLKFNDEVAQARLGLGDLGTLFRANNIKVKDTEDAFMRVADLVKNAATESQKFSILQQAGLSPTREMVRLMEQGGPVLRKQAEEAHKFTNEQLRQAQELDDLWNKMWVDFSRGAKSAFLEVATFVDKLNSAANRVAMVFSNAVPTNLLKSAFDKEKTGTGVSGTRLDQNAANSFYNTIPAFKQAAGDGSTQSPATEKELLALQQRRIAILGQMASVSDIATAKQRELNQAALENVGITGKQISFLVQKLREDELGITALKSQADASRIEAATIGLSIDKATTLRAIMALEAQDRINGRVVTEAETAARLKNAEAAGAQALATEKLNINSQIKRDRQTALLSPEDVQIANALSKVYLDIATALNSSEAAAMRFNNALKSASDIIGTGFSSFAKDIANGVAPMEAFSKAAKAAAEAVLDIAAKKVASNLLGGLLGDTASMATGATSAATILTGAGATVAAAIVAGATEAAAILGLTIPTASAALPVAGAATGVEVAAGGAVGGAALAAGGAAAGTALYGPIAILVAAVAAIGALTLFGGGGDDEAKKRDEELRKAQDAWRGMNDELRDFVNTSKGLDFSGPGAQLQSLIDEFNKLAYAAKLAHDAAGQQVAFDALANSARRLVHEFANAGDALSDGAEKIATVKQQAAGLVEVLSRQGGGELIPEVFAGVARQIAAIQASIGKGLNADVNAATGKGFLNDIDDLITKRNQLLAEGNVSGSQIQTWFDAMTQKVVDDAGLIGDSFNNLLTTFPDLAGVVHESTDALQEQIDAQAQVAQAFKSLSKDVNDFITSLKFGSNSTLSPSEQFAAAQSDFARQSTLALAKDQDAAGSITKYADTYLTQARSYLGPSAAFGSVSDQVIATLQQILSANKPAGMMYGGLVGSYVGGGMVGNGIYNIDSVVARYAGGGQIGLAGREYVMPAPQTAANFGTLEAIRAGRGPANDNGAVVAEIRAMRGDYAKVMGMLWRLLADGNMTDEQMLAEIKGVRSDLRVDSGTAKVRAKVAGSN